MRHNVDYRKLGRKTAHRLAMLQNMAVSLIRHGRIRTTLSRAKELRRLADRLVTLGKNDSVHSRRQVFGVLRDRDAVQTLFSKIAPAFAKRSGGYTRIYQIGTRPGDATDMALIEYLAEDVQLKSVKLADDSSKTAKKAAKPAAAKPKQKKTSVETKPKATKKKSAGAKKVKAEEA